MNKLTTERLEKFVNDIKTDGMCDITDYQVALALRQLLAYEQAADRPVGEIFRCSGNKTLRWWNDVPEGTVLYAAPVLPKQPELVDLSQQVEILNRILNWILKELPVPTQKASAMAIRLSSVIDIISDLELPAPAQPVIPEQAVPVALIFENHAYTELYRLEEIEIVQRMQKEVGGTITELFKGMPAQPVSEHKPSYRDGLIAAAKWVEKQREAYDSEHGQRDPDTGSFEFGNDAQLEYSTTLLEIAEGIRSLHPASAQPVSEPYKLPSGYALVPCKLTEENGAKSCMIGKFIEQTEISCPECFGDDECETCDGSGTIEVTAHVSWTTIKDIWAKGIEHFAAAPAQESE